MKRSRGRPAKYPPGLTKYQKQKLRQAEVRQEELDFLTREREQKVRSWAGFRTLLIGELKVAEAVAICRTLINAAMAGKSWAIKELYDRTDGKATTIVDMTTRRERSMAVEALRQLPPTVALQQIDAASEQLTALRSELAVKVVTVNSGVRHPGSVSDSHPGKSQSQGPDKSGQGLALDRAVSDNVSRETIAGLPQDIVVVENDNLESEISPLESPATS